MQDAGCRIKKVSLPRYLATSLFLFLFLTSFVVSPDDTAKQVAAALQAGNAQEVSKHFNPMVDLSLPGSDDTYSKAQAGQILKEFFVQNPVKSFKISKQGSSADGSTYCIGTLEAGGKSFRVYYLIKPVGGKNLVQQLQVQENT
jgi:hypothetical protein